MIRSIRSDRWPVARGAMTVSQFLAVILCSVAMGRAGRAADIYWTGTTSPSNLWSNVLAWSTSPSAASPQPAAVPGAADTAYFGISSIVLPQAVLLDGNQAAQGLVFTSTAATTLLGSSGTAPAANLLTLGTAGITVNRGAGVVTIGSAGADTVSLSLTDSQGWSVASGGQLVVRNGVVGTAATGASETLTIGGFGPSAVTGVIGDGSSGGVLNLTKTGWGSLRLSGANTFTGTTTVSGGVLVVANDQALGTGASTITVTGVASRSATPGGMILLDGVGGGIDVSRNLSLQGWGPNAGNLTLAGISGFALVNVGDNTLGGVVSTGVGSVSTRLSSAAGTLTFGPSGTLSVVGTTDFFGAGVFRINGGLAGSGGLTLRQTFLSPNASGDYNGIIGVASGRITQNGVVGSRVGVGSAAPINVGANLGGSLEIRMDIPQLQLSGTSAGIDANVLLSTNGGGLGSTFIIDHAPGGTTVGGVLPLGNIAVAVASSGAGTLVSRNGYGVTAASLTSSAASGNVFVTNNLSGTLAVSGTLWNNTATSANTLTINGSGITAVQGDLIANAGASADHAFTKGGTGLVSISGTASTLDGVVTVQDGQLQITDFRSLGTANTTAINLGSAATMGGLVIGTSVAATSGGLSTSRVINLSGTTGGGTILASQSGANPVVISSALTATGTGTKTLTLGGTSTLDNVIAGSIPNAAGSTTVSLAKIGGGVWVLSGTNAFTGAATLSDGTLKLQANSAAASGVLQDTVGITFDATNGYAGATLQYTGTGGSTAEVVGALAPTAGANTVRLTPGSGTVGLRAASLGTVNGGATVNIVGSSSGTFSFATAPTTNNMANAGLYYNGADFAYVVGNNTAVRAPVYGTDADFAVASSALTAGQSNRLDGSFSNGAVAIDSLKVNGSQTLTMTGTLTVQTGAAANASGGILQTAGSGTVAGTAVTTNGSGALVIRVDGSSDSLLLSAPIAATTTGGLTKSGAGVLLLSAANSQTGTTTVNEGTVRLAAGGRLSADNQSLTIRQAGTLDLNGISTGAAVGSFANMGTVTNSGASAATLTVGNNNGTGTSYGLVQDGVGVVNVTKVGTGAQSWLGGSTYTGTTTIGSSGLVTVDVLADINQASGIGRGNVADNAGSLVFNGSTGGLAYQGNIVSGTTVIGSRTAETNRLFTLAGTGATIASNVSNGNAIRWSSTGAIAFGSGVTAAQTITFDGSSTGDNVFLPRITNNTNAGNAATSVTKTGTGIWVLAGGSNSYTGATTISNGFLALSNTGALPANSPVALGTTTTAAVLMASGTFDRPIAASAVAGVGSITMAGSAGAGFAAYGDKLTVAIGGAANPTALTWGSGGFNPSSLIFGAATGLAEVEFRNPVSLNGAARTITVNDNGNTFADFATVSGVISGSGGLVKGGAGVLALTGANTYSGTTRFQNTLQVTSLGLSTVPGPSSVGTSVNGNLDSGAVILGDGVTGGQSQGNTAALTYVGGGETSDRKIRLGNSATGNAFINANGSGPLVLTNLVNDALAVTGTRTLVLQGSNTDFNEVRSSLNDFGGPLTVNLSNATWILSGSNAFSGGVGNIGSVPGSLGIGHDSALGTGTLNLTAMQVFAWNGDRVVDNAASWTSANNTFTFSGDYGLRLRGSLSYAGGAACNLFNTASSTATLQFDTMVMSGTTDSTLALSGDGNTTIGAITSATTFAVSLTKSGSGVLTLGTGVESSFQANAGAITMNAGTLDVRVPVSARAVTLASGTITGTSTLSGTSYSVTNASGTTAISASLLGSGTLGKSGAGSLVVSGSNSYAGVTNVTAGVLNLRNSFGLGGTAAGTTISSGAALELQEGISVTGESLTVSGSGVGNTGVLRNISGTNTLSAAITASTAIRVNSDAGLLVIDTGTLTSVQPLTFGGAGDVSVARVLNTGASALTKDGAGILTLTGSNGYSGLTTIAEGTLAVPIIGNAGTANPLGTNATVALGSGATLGTLRYTGAGETTTRVFDLAGSAGSGGTIEAIGSGALKLLRSGTVVTAASGNKTLTLTGTSLADNEIGLIGTPSGGSGTMSLVKAGSGRWVLSGSNSFSGAVNIDEGQLVLGVNASQTNGSLGTGGASNPGRTIGSAAGSGTAALLLKAGVEVSGQVITTPTGGTQTTVLGMVDTFGTGTFSSRDSAQISLGRDVTLQAATSGTIVFTNPWAISASGSNVRVTVGSAGNAGTVQLGSSLATKGTVDVTNGTLRLAAGGAISNAASIIVGSPNSLAAVLDVTPQVGTFTTGSTQTLSGTGTLLLDSNTPVSIAGVFSPGNSPGIFTFQGDGSGGATTLAGTTFMEITGTTRGAIDGYDAVNLTSGATLGLGGTLELWFSGTFANDTTFNLFTLTGTGLSGNFTGVSVSGTSSAYTGLSWTQSSGTWTSTNTAGGQALKFSSTDGTLVVVPEPATLALAAVGIGLAGWAAIRRRQ